MMVFITISSNKWTKKFTVEGEIQLPPHYNYLPLLSKSQGEMTKHFKKNNKMIYIIK